jgi:glycosyltransferase involved in cell wall biosynthesis
VVRRGIRVGAHPPWGRGMISLVVATVGRVMELERLFASLAAQTYRDFELIVVDQNPDSRLVSVLSRYRDRMTIFHVRSERGLSKARNKGLRSASGDVVAFPDDDCWYPPALLTDVADFFSRRPEWDGLITGAVDTSGRPFLGGASAAGELRAAGLWRHAPSCTIFLRSRVVCHVGDFDEALGLGADTPWQSGEETDYLLRALRAGFRLWRDPSLVVGHSAWDRMCDAAAARRGYVYGLGMGRVMRKHRVPVWLVATQVLRPLGGAVLAFLSGQFWKGCYRWAVCRGRLRGWLQGARGPLAAL